MNSPDESLFAKLRPSERKVSDLCRQGLSNKEISDMACLGVKTVKYHLTSIYKKLGVKSRAQLIFKFPWSGPVSRKEEFREKPVNHIELPKGIG